MKKKIFMSMTLVATICFSVSAIDVYNNGFDSPKVATQVAYPNAVLNGWQYLNCGICTNPNLMAVAPVDGIGQAGYVNWQTAGFDDIRQDIPGPTQGDPTTGSSTTPFTPGTVYSLTYSYKVQLAGRPVSNEIIVINKDAGMGVFNARPLDFFTEEIPNVTYFRSRSLDFTSVSRTNRIVFRGLGVETPVGNAIILDNVTIEEASEKNFGFEVGSFHGWTDTGQCWNGAPLNYDNAVAIGGWDGTYYACSRACNIETTTGTLQSKNFTIPAGGYLEFLAGGYSKASAGDGGTDYNYVILCDADTDAELDRVYMPGTTASMVTRTIIPPSAYQGTGKNVYIKVVDDATGGGWSWMSFDKLEIKIAGDEFVDVTSAVGLGDLESATLTETSIAWVDYNNDGRPDIHTGATLDGSQGEFLFRNANGSSFVQMDSVAVGPMQYPGIFADVDNDGNQDWYMSWAGNHGRENNNNGASFTVRNWPNNAYQSECMVFGDFNNDSLLDIYRTGWEQASGGPYYPDSIYTNAGNGIFVLNWEQSVVPNRAGRGVTTADFDEDGDMDIYVSNYRLGPNFLWINDGSGNFVNRAQEFGAEGNDNLCIGSGGATTSHWYGHTIGSVFCDLDNDGHLDLIVGNFDHNSSCGGVGFENPDYQDNPQFLRNMGSGGSWHFEDKTATVNLPWVESHASPAPADFDNDGDLDFFISSVAGGNYPGQKCTLMRNDGNWSFTDISVDAGLDITTTKSNFQAAWADYDDDGDLDLFTGRKLFKNPTMNGNHWLKVKLTGDSIVNANRDAIGAIARITIGAETLTRQVDGAIGWNNQNERTLHFGLGTETGPVTVDVTWPNGSTSSGSYNVDQTVTMSIPEGGIVFSILFSVFGIWRKFIFDCEL